MDPATLAAKYGLPVEFITQHVEIAKRSKAPKMEHIEVTEGGVTETLKVTREGIGPLDTEHGTFHHFSFRISDAWEKYSAVVCAALDSSFRPLFDLTRPIRLRTDSGCETGQLFGDRTCECREQLHLGLKQIQEAGQGLLVSIPRQDGRGMGLPFKLATLHLQKELGLDTVEAASLLEPTKSRDVRTYAGVIAILKFLGVAPSARLDLASNNPSKAKVFFENHYENVGLVGCVIAPTPETLRHLQAKQTELGHIALIRNEPEKDA